jgi:uncharacterized SAM-binding protein YcdF (DUF218 family)
MTSTPPPEHSGPPDGRALELARILWNYLHLGHQIERSDLIVVFGSTHVGCAEWGARLWLEGWAPWIVMSGGRGRLTAHWERPEAEVFAAAAERLGVPRDRILTESCSRNTGENVRFTRCLVEEKGLDPRSCILVHTPHMERRVLATFTHFWPGKKATVTSPPLSLEAFAPSGGTFDRFIHRLAGEVHRILEYPPRGFQAPMEVPREVHEAWKELVSLGYDRDLVA